MAIYPPTADQTQTPTAIELQEHHAPDLERRLLVRGVKRMAAGRVACSRCQRAPLVGERLHVFGREREEQAICELCVKRAPEGSLGEPLRIDRVHAAERPLNVRRAAA